MPTITVIPTQVGNQRGDGGAEGTALACILEFPQVGLVVRYDYRHRASIMPIWVPACAGMTERELCVGGKLENECGLAIAGTPYGVLCWGWC